MIKEITMNRTLLITATTGLLIAIAGCDKTTSEQASKAADQAQPNNWLITNAPEGAVSITDAKATAKEGDTVVIRGRIGGRHTPINNASPVFTIVDLALPHCNQEEEDMCSTPWDYCCETSNTITENSATVQIVGNGNIDPVAAGFEPLDEVILIGTVGPRPSDEVYTIQATGVFRSDG
jgi:hypothetical protein